MQVLSSRIYKIWRSLMRHRDRYVRAWMAHYGAHPSLVQMVTFPKTADVFGDERGEVMRLEYRKDTDAVAELVKAAAVVVTQSFHNTSGGFWELSDEHAKALEKALKPFEGS